MCYFLAFFLAVLPASQSPAKPVSATTLSTIIDGVQRSFARMRDFSADFVQVYEDSLNRRQQESGHLYLMRSQKMRWEYKSPEEKFFISDGKDIYFYVPADKQVNKEKVRETFDDRMPMMFLLGRSNLRDEFTQFERLDPFTKPIVPGMAVIRMTPNRKTDLSELIMEVDPASYQLRRLVLTHSDGASSEFIFSKIQINTGLKASLFDFKVPPGVDVVEGIGQ
jgi:outer membrane lipoprotein carrier protein